MNKNVNLWSWGSLVTFFGSLCVMLFPYSSNGSTWEEFSTISPKANVIIEPRGIKDIQQSSTKDTAPVDYLSQNNVALISVERPALKFQ